MRTQKVLLVSMPFGALERQALGISLLKAILNERGMHCDIRYLTFPFAELIGTEDYIWLSNDVPHTAFAGDWIFAGALHGKNPVAEGNYICDVLQDEWKLGNASIRKILNARGLVPSFMEYCMETIPWEEYSVVGFTSTFEQNLASLALARKIKTAHPDIQTVFGGANWEGEMGKELHARFSFVDFVCDGEADVSFPMLVEKYY